MLTFTHGELDEVNIGDVEALCREEVAEAEQQEGHVRQQSEAGHQFEGLLGVPLGPDLP